MALGRQRRGTTRAQRAGAHSASLTLYHANGTGRQNPEDGVHLQGTAVARQPGARDGNSVGNGNCWRIIAIGRRRHPATIMAVVQVLEMDRCWQHTPSAERRAPQQQQQHPRRSEYCPHVCVQVQGCVPARAHACACVFAWTQHAMPRHCCDASCTRTPHIPAWHTCTDQEDDPFLGDVAEVAVDDNADEEVDNGSTEEHRQQDLEKVVVAHVIGDVQRQGRGGEREEGGGE